MKVRLLQLDNGTPIGIAYPHRDGVRVFHMRRKSLDHAGLSVQSLSDEQLPAAHMKWGPVVEVAEGDRWEMLDDAVAKSEKVLRSA